MLTNLVRERRDTLSVLIDKKGELHIKAPLYMPLGDILKFVNSKEKWISKKSEQVKQILRINEPIINYEKVLYLGAAYKPVFVARERDIKIEGNFILIPEKYQLKHVTATCKWLKAAAVAVIENRLLYLANLFNLKFKNMGLCNSRSKWGICNDEKELFFNWRLIMLPPKIIDYIIVHELAHLIELNHSKEYWQLVEKMMPKYKEQKEILKQSGYILQLYR